MDSCQHPAISLTDRLTTAGTTSLCYQCDDCSHTAVLYRLPDETPTPEEIRTEFVRPPRRVVDGARY